MRNSRSHRRAAPRRAQGGMTLIEITVVILLIGGIMAVIANQVIGKRDAANHRLAKIQVQQVAANIEAYQSDVGEYPRTLDDLVTDPELEGWLGPYGKQTDMKDPWKKALNYQVPGETGAFDLISYGKDGQPGGSSVDADIRYEP